MIEWRECSECGGCGEVEGLIGLLPCSGCGGHKRQPAGGSGAASFFKAEPRQSIALLYRWGDAWRVSFWDRSGPFSHYDAAADKIMDELRGYLHAPTAARLLDYWATRPAWEKGISRSLFLAYVNAFSFHGRRDLALEVQRAPDLETANRLAGRLKRQYLPDVNLF